jgi:hypothetical protein
MWHAPVGWPKKKRESGLGKKKKNSPAYGIVPFLMKSKFSIDLNLKWSKGYPPELEEFQLKYCYEVFGERYNFIHKNSKFEMEF